MEKAHSRAEIRYWSLVWMTREREVEIPIRAMKEPDSARTTHPKTVGKTPFLNTLHATHFAAL